MTNEELAEAIRCGERSKLLELWEQVKSFAAKRARKWEQVAEAYSGMTHDDLMQTAFVALLEAVEGWDANRAGFLTWYSLKLRATFSAACGMQSKRTSSDPLRAAFSIYTPLDDDTDDTFADTFDDPAALEEIENVADRDMSDRLRTALDEAISSLPREQQEAVRLRYWHGQTVDKKLHDAALRALRHPNISSGLKPFK